MGGERRRATTGWKGDCGITTGGGRGGPWLRKEASKLIVWEEGEALTDLGVITGVLGVFGVLAAGGDFGCGGPLLLANRFPWMVWLLCRCRSESLRGEEISWEFFRLSFGLRS